MTRRYGSGSISAIKDANQKTIGYRGQPMIGGKRRSFRAKTKTEVQRMIDEAKVAHAQGRLHAGKAQTVAEYLWAWLETKKRSQSLRVKTLECYEMNIRERLAPHIGTKKLTDLRPADVQDAYNQLIGRGLSPYSVIQAHRLLHKALSDAVKLDILVRNVTEAVDPPRIVRKEMKTLTVDQLETLFEKTHGDRFHALWIVLGLVGLRRSEAVGLKWSDIDFDAGTLTVKRGLHRYKNGGGLQFTEPKSETSRRTISLPKPVIRALQERKSQQAFERKAARGSWYRRTAEIIAVSNLRKSNYGPRYYFNQAFWLRSFGSELYPKEWHCHVRTRLENLPPDREQEIEDLLNLDAPMSDEVRAARIRHILDGNLSPVIEWASSIAGLRTLLEEGKVSAMVGGHAQEAFRLIPG